MRMLKHLLALVGAVTLLTLTASNAPAQERQRGEGFDPEQMRARMMERYREQLEVTNDDEWKLIEGRIAKVMEARREVGFGGGGGFGRGPRRGGEGGDERGGDRRRFFGGEPSPEAEALQKALDAKAPAEEIKAKLAKLREVQKVKEAKLAQAREELRKVLSIRQEAVAVLNGLL